LEITSLSITLSVLPTVVTDKWLFGKLEAAVDHILEKSASSFPGFSKGGAVIYETIFSLLTRFHSKLDTRLLSLTRILDNELDFLAFVPQPASINGKSSFEEYPTVFYVKDGPLVEIFKTAFRDKSYTIIVLK
jgi:hypothetical protein